MGRVRGRSTLVEWTDMAPGRLLHMLAKGRAQGSGDSIASGDQAPLNLWVMGFPSPG